MHIFITDLRPCPRTEQWPFSQSCQLLSDSLPDLKRFASSLGLYSASLQWSVTGTPSFTLPPPLRTRAFLAGALVITSCDLDALDAFWRARSRAALSRLLAGAPAFAARLRFRP